MCVVHGSTLVFDGDCAFCTRAAARARRMLPEGCRVVAWQMADLPAIRVTSARAQREVLWVAPSGRVSGGARAVAGVLRASGRPWSWLGLALMVPPISWTAQAVYRVVAANRVRLPGGTAACAVPPPDDQP
ncbi:MAG: putative thiol-disulfide oxidoreductase [Frankiales bacterium]|nr:putative thiol-disulfide oxidoreductase [Frankiales bacterium]